jgi:hypothetical protein
LPIRFQNSYVSSKNIVSVRICLIQHSLAAFSHKMDNLSVERAAVAFSENFIGDDEYWSDLKDTLLIVSISMFNLFFRYSTLLYLCECN